MTQLAAVFGAFFSLRAQLIADGYVKVEAIETLLIEAEAKGLIVDGVMTPEAAANYASRIAEKLPIKDWTDLATPIETGLNNLMLGGAEAGAKRLAIAVSTDLVAAEAIEYAANRAAQLIGLDADGGLLGEATRAMIRDTIARGLVKGSSPAEIAETLREAYAFSDARSMTIARTEFSLATNRGLLAQYKASGLVFGTKWSTAEDEKVDQPICQLNADAGIIPLGEIYPSGDEAPPAHPNCRCTLLPITHTAHSKEADE